MFVKRSPQVVLLTAVKMERNTFETLENQS